MEKKSQVAIEAIMIYGLAILVVVLAIGALMYFGVLDLGSLLPDKCEIKGVALTCENYVVTPTGASLELRNNLGKNIDITSIKVYGEKGTDMEGMWAAVEATAPCQNTTTTRVINGDMKKIDLATNCAITIPVGKKISGIIELKYKIVGSNIDIVKFGDIRTSVQ